MTIIGIDPGSNGGIAWFSNGNVCVEKIPNDLKDLYEILRDISYNSHGNLELVHCYLEKVHSSPQMGVVSAFSFGNGYGHIEMALTANRIPFEKVRPQTWMKDLDCMTKGDKNISKNKAQAMFPDIKVTHAIADALLIMSYGRKQQKQ